MGGSSRRNSSGLIDTKLLYLLAKSFRTEGKKRHSYKQKVSGGGGKKDEGAKPRQNNPLLSFLGGNRGKRGGGRPRD